MSLSPGNGLERITKFGNMTVAPTADGLMIHATTGDPNFILPPVAASNGKWTVHVKLVSPATATFEVFYNTRKFPDFERTHSVRKSLRQGDNDVTVEFSEPDFQGKIRIDPGDVAGDYLIKLIEVNLLR